MDGPYKWKDRFIQSVVKPEVGRPRVQWRLHVVAQCISYWDVTCEHDAQEGALVELNMLHAWKFTGHEPDYTLTWLIVTDMKWKFVVFFGCLESGTV